MYKINRQFFALPGELVDIVEGWREDFGFHLVIMQLFPEVKVFEIGKFSEIEDLRIDLDDIFCVFLGPVSPDSFVKDRYDFLEKNPDFLAVDFGRFDGKGLGESWLVGMTDNLDLKKLWKKIGNQLRSMTKGGVWAFNMELGGKNFYKDLRYTSGVEEFCKKGGKLHSHGTFTRFSIDEP